MKSNKTKNKPKLIINYSKLKKFRIKLKNKLRKMRFKKSQLWINLYKLSKLWKY